MPANLPPQYFEVEKKYRSAKAPEDKLAALEEMLAIMPKHKGTDKIRADLKRRISKLKAQEQKKGGKRVFGFNIKSEGAGQIALVGPPNSGKSALLRALTRAEPEVADYPFTTRVPLAGMARFEDVQLQLVDLPPLAGEYIEPWVPDQIRRADLILVLLDLTGDPLHQLETLEALLAEKKIFLSGGPTPPDAWSGIIKPCFLAANKLDQEGAEDTLELFTEMLEPGRYVLPLSVQRADNLDLLPGLLFRALGIIRVYTKMRGKPADKESPYILPQGTTVMDLAAKIHKDIAGKFQYARIWGGDKYEGQKVQRDYILCDLDIIEIHV